jgi:hypothetical protein
MSTNYITRIKNNQVTDANIVAYAKLVPGSITGALFNPDMSINSNITIIGNLAVSGNTSTINSVNTYIQDPIVTFNSGYSGSIPAGYEIGMLINRNLSTLGPYGAVNVAWIWNETDQAFEAIATATTGNALSTLTSAGFANINAGNITATSMQITGTGTFSAPGGIVNSPISGSTGYFTTEYAGNISSANVLFSGGAITNTPISGNTGYFTTLQAGNLSSPNVLITGGNITALYSAAITTEVATNFSTGNAFIFGAGSYIQSIANVSATYGNVVNTNTTYANATTSYATNFSTANAQITGAGTNIGLGSLINNVYSNNGYFGNLSGGNILLGNLLVVGTLFAANASTPNIVISGGYISNLANATIGNINGNTVFAGNLSSGNAQITGATSFVGTGATPIASLYVRTEYAGNLSTPNALITSEAVTTGVTTNFSTGNAQITGATSFVGTGTTPVASVYAVTEYATNLSTANALIASETVTTGVTTNFSTGNAQITGATSFIGTGATPIASAYVTTEYASNLSAANAIIAKGYADSFPIGANVAATGAFTTLTASGETTLTSPTPSTSSTTGALVVSGGVGVGGDVNIGGNLAVKGTLTYINTTQEIVTGVEVVAGNLVANSGTASTSTSTGALVVLGGAGISGNIWSGAGLQGTPIGNAVASTGSFTSLSVSGAFINTGNVVAASGTASTNTTTGALVVAGTGGAGIGGTLNVGGIVQFTNSTNNTGPSTGAFQVPNGGAYIAGNLYVGGNINLNTSVINQITGNNAQFYGNVAGFGAFYAGISTGYVPDGQTVTQETANFNGYAGIVTGQNLYPGAQASADIFLSPDNGTYNDTYLDMGIASSVYNYPGYALIKPNDVYLYNAGNTVTGGGNVLIATAGANDIVFAVQGLNTNNEVMRITSANTIVIKSTTNSTSKTTGVLSIAGGIGVQGNVYANQGNIGNMLFSSSGSIYDDQATGNQIFQTSTNNLTYGMGFGTEAVANSIVYSSGGITFSTGKTLHAGAIPTGGVTNITMDAGGNLLITTTTTSTSAGSGALQVFGGAGVGGNLYVGGALNVPNAYITTNANIAGLQAQAIGNVAPGSGVFTTLKAIGVFTLLSNLVASASTPSTSTTNGAIVVPNGGIGVSDTSYFGSTLTVNSGVYALGTYTGTMTNGVVLDYSSGSNQARISLGSSNDGLGVYNTGLAGNPLLTLDQAGNITAYGSAFVNSIDESYGTTTGALQVAGGVGISSNLWIGGQTFAEGNVQLQQAATINSSQLANFDFIVRGHTDNTLIWARPGSIYDQVLIGNSATTANLITGAKLIINSSDSMLLPAGTTTQRPDNVGGTAVAGMLRYSTTTSTLEYYNGSIWKVPGQEFTIIVDNQFNGDGGTVAFQLTNLISGSAGLTTAGTLVSINGVLQIPTIAYSTFSSNNTVVFTEAPAVGDLIDVRTLTTTATPQFISDTSGYNNILATASGVEISTGTVSSNTVVSWAPGGAQVNQTANVTVTTSGSATTIDSFAFGSYASAEYTVTATIANTNIRWIGKVLVVTDGSTVYTTSLGGVGTASNTLATLSGTVNSGTVNIKATVTNNNTILRINKLYQPV